MGGLQAAVVLSLGLAHHAAASSCYQPVFDERDTCCVPSNRDVTFFDAESPLCTQFGHGRLGGSDYLRPLNGSMDRGHEEAFQEAFLKQGIFNTLTYRDCHTSWLGVTVRQPVQDMMIIQQLVYALRPRLFVELGSYRGGLAYYVATLFELLAMEDGRVLSVDEYDKEHFEARRCFRGPHHQERSNQRRAVGALNQDRIWRQHVRELVALSTSPRAIAGVRREVRRLPPGAAVIITLDSDHAAEHVWDEIQLYAPLVPVGSYLIVQDVILDYVKQPWQGPKVAVDRLLRAGPAERERLGHWFWDRSVEVYGYTGHMYLRRVA